MKRPAVFLDRDGTLTEEVGYVNHLSRLRVMPGVCGALFRLNRAGVAVVVVTNQAGAARGYFPASFIDEVQAELVRQIEAGGAKIDGLYYCPHHPSSRDPALAVDCNCRKPKPGLIERACAELDLDPTASFVVGDKYTDVELAHRVGAQGILVLTGYGRGEMQWFSAGWPAPPDFIAEDLNEATDHILRRLGLDG